jgi:DNA-binding NtrC family response regulator
MDSVFSIWILSRRPEIFDWRDRSLWPEGYGVVVFENSDLLLSNLEARKPNFVLLDWELVSQHARPLIAKIAREEARAEIYLINLPEESPIYNELGSWELSGAFSPSYSANDLRDKIQEYVDLKSILEKAGIVGRSMQNKRTAAVLKQIAPTDATVLISGESGTGKELLARAIHNNSTRRAKPYVSVNCAAITESLLESELFGHEKGAFTGADRRHLGYFESASGGSIFLDEIGEFKLDLQARLLRVLEQKAFFRVGGREQISADVRVICATNRNLMDLVDEGRFRADLYYRLSVIQMLTEPLRKRPEDIFPLCVYFLSQLESEAGKIAILPEAISMLTRYSWPGNVRELKNFVQSTAYLTRDSKIKATDVERFIQQASASNRTLPVVTGISGEQADFEMIYRALLNLAREIAEMKTMLADRRNEVGTVDRDNEVKPPRGMEIKPETRTLQEMEKEMIEKALKAASSNRKLAAQYLGIGERTLYRKLKEYNIR